MSAYRASQYTRPVVTLLLALGLTLTLLLVVNSAIPVTRAAGPWYVAPPPVGNDGNTCDSEATPCATINAAVARASAGDTINLAAGTYTENITVAVSLSFAGSGANSTIVDGNLTDRVFNIVSGTVSIADLTIQNGSTSGDGGGIYSTEALSLTNVNVLSNTAAGSGGGLAVDQALNLIGARFMNNTAYQGGGVYLNGDSSHSTLRNILLAGNTATSAQGNALFDNSGGMLLDFATIASPTLGRGSAVYSYARHWSTNVFNTLVASHTVGYEDPEGEPGHINAQSTLFSGVITPYVGSEITTGGNSFTGTAGFADPPGGDYHLTLDSDAINRAPCWPCLDTDLDSNPRPVGCGYDIGAYEYQTAPDCMLTIATAGPGIVTPTVGTHPYAYGTTAILTASTSSPWSFGGWGGDAGSASYSTLIFMNGDKTVTATFGLPACYATSDNGFTIESSPNAAAVQRALDLAAAGDKVKVAGTCAGMNRRYYSNYPYPELDLTKSLTILGGYTVTDWLTSYPLTQPTVLDAQQAGRVLSIFEEADVTLADLTIQNGKSVAGGGIYGARYLTLTNVAIISNTATGIDDYCGVGNGGGVVVEGDAFVTGSRFERNVSVADYCSRGGGLYTAWGNLYLTNTVFLSNTAAGRGGGAYAGNNIILNGGQFQANRGSQGGGLYAGVDLMLTGTRFTNNTADRGGGIYLGGSYGSYNSLTNVILDRNTATSAQGNAIFANFVFPNTGVASLRHGTIVSSSQGNGSAIYGDANDWIIHNTLIDNYTIGYEQALNAQGWIYEYRTLFSGVITPYVGSNIDLDSHSFNGVPGFVDLIGGDYHLTASSEAINRGVELYDNVAIDFDGNPRPDGCGYDIGAYEYQAAPDCLLTVNVVGTGVVTPAVGIHPYAYGEVVALTASTSAPWGFGGWSGAVNSTANSASVFMLSDNSVTATFVIHHIYLPLILK